MNVDCKQDADALPPVAGSAEKYGRVRKMLGIYYIVGHDTAGWWITGKTGYKTMMNVAHTTVTAPDGNVAHQIILGRWMIMVMRRQNETSGGTASRTPPSQ